MEKNYRKSVYYKQTKNNFFEDQLCLGIIASGIGFVLAQRTPFRFPDIRRRL